MTPTRRAFTLIELPAMRKRGFTLIELLVVVTIIVVLLALLTPAMDRAMEQAQRAVCGANQDAIGSATLIYTLENRGAFFITYGRNSMIFFGPKETQGGTTNLPGDNQTDWLAAMASVGLFTAKEQQVSRLNGQAGPFDHGPTKVWSCPSRTTPAGLWSPADPVTYYINYSYMGGIVTWTTPVAVNRPSRSPVRRPRSEGSWVLTADSLFRFDNTWVRTDTGPTPHSESPNAWPEGGNHLTVDGAVAWIDFDETFQIHSWNNNIRQFFMKQADLGGYVPPNSVYGSKWKR